MGTTADDATTQLDRGLSLCNRVLNKLFSSCAKDPRSSIYRAWGVTLLLILAFFVVSIVEMINLHRSQKASKSLVIASIWTGLVHLILGGLGTFVLKRFPTSFSVGFFLGVVVVIANQNLILYGTFHGYRFGSPATNEWFSNLSLALFLLLTFMGLLLFHFKRHIVVAPIDAAATKSSALQRRSSADEHSSSAAEYQVYEDPSSATNDRMIGEL